MERNKIFDHEAFPQENPKDYFVHFTVDFTYFHLHVIKLVISFLIKLQTHTSKSLTEALIS